MIIHPQGQGLIHRCYEFASLLAGCIATKNKPRFTVLDRVTQPANTVDHTRLRGAHGKHLTYSTGLEARWHQEQVATTVQAICYRF